MIEIRCGGTRLLVKAPRFIALGLSRDRGHLFVNFPMVSKTTVYRARGWGTRSWRHAGGFLFLPFAPGTQVVEKLLERRTGQVSPRRSAPGGDSPGRYLHRGRWSWTWSWLLDQGQDIHWRAWMTTRTPRSSLQGRDPGRRGGAGRDRASSGRSRSH